MRLEQRSNEQVHPDADALANQEDAPFYPGPGYLPGERERREAEHLMPDSYYRFLGGSVPPVVEAAPNAVPGRASSH